MPGTFSVHVDPDELAAQSVASAFAGSGGRNGKAAKSGKGAAKSITPPLKARGGQSAAQPRRYAFRRS